MECQFNEQRKESGLIFHVMGRKNEAQSGETIGPRSYNLKKKATLGENTSNFYSGLCHIEIKRCLLLGRKVMTNLDSILKSRDITLL